ncbi:hypothetical protein AGMMS50248_01540 [Deltaproteobacteria bacterium]|nr:hypothetical protein AGMMS50248_01540 [Deltaproteobacteria bacterium]
MQHSKTQPAVRIAHDQFISFCKRTAAQFPPQLVPLLLRESCWALPIVKKGIYAELLQYMDETAHMIISG